MRNQTIKWWPWIVTCLVLVNLGTLILFWMNERDRMGGSTPKELIANELHFDDKQKAAFEIIVKKHQDQSAQIRVEIREAKKAYYQLGPKNKKATHELTFAYAKLEALNYSHFEEIRAICKTDQKDALNRLLNIIISGSNFGMMGPPGLKL